VSISTDYRHQAVGVRPERSCKTAAVFRAEHPVVQAKRRLSGIPSLALRLAAKRINHLGQEVIPVLLFHSLKQLCDAVPVKVGYR
jgi:hypothetical protein